MAFVKFIWCEIKDWICFCVGYTYTVRSNELKGFLVGDVLFGNGLLAAPLLLLFYFFCELFFLLLIRGAWYKVLNFRSVTLLNTLLGCWFCGIMNATFGFAFLKMHSWIRLFFFCPFLGILCLIYDGPLHLPYPPMNWHAAEWVPVLLGWTKPSKHLFSRSNSHHLGYNHPYGVKFHPSHIYDVFPHLHAAACKVVGWGGSCWTFLYHLFSRP